MSQYTNQARRWGVLIVSAIALTLSACGDTNSNNGSSNQSLEVEGDWVTNFGSALEIDEEMWGGQAVVEFDNQDNFAITEAENSESGMLEYSKLVWTEPSDGSWWYCTVDFGLESQEAALNTEKTADDSNPSEGGCGQFAWTRVRMPIELTGSYDTQFGTTETITATTWEFGIEAAIVDWDNEANWAVTQNPEDAETSPNAFNKVVWTEPDAQGAFYYCTVDFGLETEEAARTTDKTADDSNPEESGCGEFAWTKMTPAEG
jgi:hypothetical protein